MLIQVLGYVASALVFGAFYMRTMLPLRYVAIASNIAFISYGVPLHLWPVVILHVILLPLNLVRLFQIRRLLLRIKTTRGVGLDLGALLSSMRRERHAAGAIIFSPGQKGDCAYLLAKGEVDIPNVSMHVSPGEVFGEGALLAPDGIRFGNAVARTDVELYRIDSDSIGRAFYQYPAFAFALVRLLTGRLVSHIRQLEEERAAATA